MGALQFLSETVLFSLGICALHALKPRLGLAPLFLIIGLLEVFLFVAGKGGSAHVELLGTDPARIAGIFFLPLLLVIMANFLPS